MTSLRTFCRYGLSLLTLAGCQSLVGLDDYGQGNGGRGGSGSTARGGAGGSMSMVSSVASGGAAVGGSLAGGASAGGSGGTINYDVCVVDPMHCLDPSGLVVRYFLDDQPPAPGPALAAVDSGPALPADLVAGGIGGSLNYVEESPGNTRGLHWDSTDITRRMISSASTQKFSAIKKAVTIEVVAGIDDLRDGPEESFFLQRNSDQFAFTARDEDQDAVTFSLRARGTNERVNWRYPAFDKNRHVLHVVVDVTRGSTLADKYKFYVDGVSTIDPLIGANSTPGVAFNDFAVPDGQLVVGNTQGGTGRAVQGTIGYVAVYNEAFTPERLSQHVARLLAGDDTLPVQ